LSNIIPFQFPDTGQTVRTVEIDGEPWFVGMDVTAILGYANGRDVLASLPGRMRNTVAIPDGNRGNPNRGVVSESGVYRLIMRSNLPTAERFQDWLAEEVIPSIRRTGSYTMAPPAPALPDLTSPAGVLALAEQFVATARQLVAADERIAELEPKAVIADRFLTAQKGDRLVRQVAKELAWREKDLRRFLLDEGMIFARERACDSATEYDFYASMAGKFRTVEHPVEHRFGPCNHYTLYVTPLGMGLIQRRIERQQASIRASIAGGAQ
jgi:anti-repressor protein